MNKIKRLLKIISWRLRGSPRCRRCGKPLYDWKEGDKIGPGCRKQAREVLAEVFTQQNPGSKEDPNA